MVSTVSAAMPLPTNKIRRFRNQRVSVWNPYSLFACLTNRQRKLQAAYQSLNQATDDTFFVSSDA
jgi:hypothetical protein